MTQTDTGSRRSSTDGADNLTAATTSEEAIEPPTFTTAHKIRLVTATSLFDGHDAAINIMRRIAQSAGAEVIHLGHDRSAGEIVDAAIEEDAQAIAITSYQGGHNEFFKYVHDLLNERGCGHIKIFGGGGGVILPAEIADLEQYGICKIYSPDDGRRLGLQGMIHDMLRRCDFATPDDVDFAALTPAAPRSVARAISWTENAPDEAQHRLDAAGPPRAPAPVIGITGTGGAGKSSLIDELVRRYLLDFEERTIAIVSVDPTRRRTGGALLGDRIRMNSLRSSRVFMRSLATRQANVAIASAIPRALQTLRLAGFDLIILETSGIGQSDTVIADLADIALYVMTPEYGAATQLEKIAMLDYADLVAINKFDRRGAKDALRDVKKQYRRNRQQFELPDESTPVFGTTASRFNDAGTNRLYGALIRAVDGLTDQTFSSSLELPSAPTEQSQIIGSEQIRYLGEIAGANRRYARWATEQSQIARKMFQLRGALEQLRERGDGTTAASLEEVYRDVANQLDNPCQKQLDAWDEIARSYQGEFHTFTVRDREVKVRQCTESLSRLSIPKVALPTFADWGERLRWLLTENLPGRFPYSAGVFPFKREGEDPTRMFAGEGGPERTNRRFHYVSRGQPAKRLSTAFDSVTLYGENPALRPDIYGKVGNAGVSVCTLDDAKKLYSGFDLADPKTSVSMTINGPAPMLLGFFLNAAIDQQCERYIHEHGLVSEVEGKIAAIYQRKGATRPRYDGDLPEGNDGLGLMLLGVTGDQVLPADIYGQIRDETLKSVRGTVQADILKEDQAQNTCIFSTEFALRMMGDIQQYFVDHGIRNFYSVSISGYHIAEAGANPITQLALTLSNGFTYVEYYLARGMKIDDFARNLSFFFSNGIDPEYAVIGRVARRIWAKAMRDRYGANERSQKLKYHIQTSGRSLHAHEIQFNDIRTTLQALYAIYDNCQSLHTNAYDEAITTPTEESVRRAIAIQLIINRELGLAKNENPLQGSFIIEQLSDLVEEAVLHEFDQLSERGGVLGAMETMYQRGKIQDESLYYETLKNSGELPIVGVNTFLADDGSPIQHVEQVMRSTEDEKQFAIHALEAFHQRNCEDSPSALTALQQTALRGDNIFDSLMAATKVCSLGQISGALYDVGGRYRRSM